MALMGCILWFPLQVEGVFRMASCGWSGHGFRTGDGWWFERVSGEGFGWELVAIVVG